MTDDMELERAFRAGLQRAADRAEVGVPLTERAHTGARTRRRRRWTAVAAATAVVVIVGGATAVVRNGDGDDPGRTDHTAVDPTPVAVTEWRAESWHGLTVDVPADWGWGTAPGPISMTPETDVFCPGPGAMVTADGMKRVDPAATEPWVGRPIILSDLCVGARYDSPKAAYVWLGADVEPGTVDVGGGYTQETVEAFGTTLTVATRDEALRGQIMDSARATTDCDAQLPSRPEVVGMPTEGLDPVHSAQVCAYEKGDSGFDLVYAGTLDESAQVMYDAGGTGSKAAQAFCADGGDEYVRITFSGKDAMGTAELTADRVVDPLCRQVEVGPGLVLPLDEGGMTSWSQSGLQAVLRAFIGGLG